MSSIIPSGQTSTSAVSHGSFCITVALPFRIAAGLIFCATVTSLAQESTYRERLIFPLQTKHVHSSCIIECPNGDLLACWFQGSGERRASDVAIMGARLRHGSDQWSAVFPMADTPDLPDLNPVLFIDSNQELWLFWITVLAERWEDSLLRFRKTTNYVAEGPPQWHWQDDLLLKPDDRFAEALHRGLAAYNESDADYGSLVLHPFAQLVDAAKDLGKRQRGWMSRTHLQVLPSGRILFPLYSDGYYVGLMAISDDNGRHWHASQPIVGIGLNQPSVVRKRDGTLVAYLRREGPPPRRVQLSLSRDDGESWSTATATEIPNPDSSLEVISLKDGRWVMAYNDSEKLDDRSRLVLALSDDEGATWKWKRSVENTPGGRFHYPSLIQTRDGRLNLTYTYQPHDEQHRSIKHVTLDADWIKSGSR
jgi:predicted neuraminidase